MSFSHLNLLVFHGSDSALLSASSTRSIRLKDEWEINESDTLNSEATSQEQNASRGILQHLKLLASGTKTMWRMLLCSFFYTFLIFEETPIFFAVI